MIRWTLLLLLATAVGTTEPCYVTIERPAPPARVPLTTIQYARTIEQFEGRRLSVYRDSRGRYTIGAGHRCTRSHPTLTNAQVDLLLIQDTLLAIDGARRLVCGFDELPDPVQLIVVDMIYNLGRTGFSEFSEFRAAIAKRDWRTAAWALRDSDWCQQVPARSFVHLQTLESLCR